MQHTTDKVTVYIPYEVKKYITTVCSFVFTYYLIPHIHVVIARQHTTC